MYLEGIRSSAKATQGIPCKALSWKSKCTITVLEVGPGVSWALSLGHLRWGASITGVVLHLLLQQQPRGPGKLSLRLGTGRMAYDRDCLTI